MLKRVFAVLLFSISACLAYSINITVLGGIENESYPRDNTGQLYPPEIYTPEPYEDSPGTWVYPDPEIIEEPAVFSPKIQAIGSIEVSGDVRGIFEYSVKYNWDTIWRNTVISNFNYHLKVFNLGFGLFIGGNDFLMRMLDIGFLGRLGIELEKKFFIDFTAGASIDSKLDVLDTSTRQLINARLGWWLPHIYNYFDYSLVKYFEKVSDTQKIENSLATYKVRMEFFNKNVPFRITSTLGYKNHTRIYTATDIEEVATVTTFFLGLGFNLKFAHYWRWVIEGEVMMDFKKTPDVFPPYFRAVTGIIFQYPERDY
jgi:hypothetical protein